MLEMDENLQMAIKVLVRAVDELAGPGDLDLAIARMFPTLTRPQVEKVAEQMVRCVANLDMALIRYFEIDTFTRGRGT